MIFSWFRNRRRRRLLAEPFPDQWHGYLTRNLQFYDDLSPDEQATLRDMARVFVAEKDWVGCGGLEVTDEMKITVAAQACLLILNIEHDYYRRVQSVLLYPATYRTPYQQWSAGGVVREGEAATLGQAAYRGPVALSWASALAGGRDEDDGRNVVFHEFAHKLDMMDDIIDGTPVLHARGDYADWASVMTREYDRLCGQADRGKATLLDKYGATNEAEFFAVTTECFFEKPAKLREKHLELYELMQRYYRQDPAGRIGRRSRS